ncbi:MAG: DNA-3-methyladenine glycosylase I [Gammaproteobacteria bacterium]|nr:DNA-3-methyladenine glycosylase I [Gammaproteobacteria bacterium]MBQ0840658.1 DNA-3-methyladenine glycosylase I [Gammaproteobacteria bacterium]
MVSFQTLYEAALRNWGEEKVQALLPDVSTGDELRATGDDRYLSAMARCVFRAGFSWKVIAKKWPDFETVFGGFTPLALANYSDERIDTLMGDTRIVRHRTKIQSVRDNALFICDIQHSHGSFANYIADWPEESIVELWFALKKRGGRLGGNTGPGFLRLMGKDTFMLSKDVCAVLLNHQLMDSLSPNSKRDLLKVQAIFNRFQQDSAYPLSHISRIMALSLQPPS